MKQPHKNPNIKPLIITNVIFLVFFAGFIYFFSLSLSKPKLSDITLHEGKMLPSIQELVDLNGDFIDEMSLSNGKVLLNVWASWCITCLVEHPFLSKLSKGEDLIIIGHKSATKSSPPADTYVFRGETQI